VRSPRRSLLARRRLGRPLPPAPGALGERERGRVGVSRRGGWTALLLVGVLGASVSALGCAGEQRQPQTAAEYAEHARAAYEEALEAFYDRDWVTVIPLMEEVKRQYAGTQYARLAQLRIADAHFRQESFPEAITAYRDFVRDYPNDPEVPYARYRIVLCQFQSSGASAFLPPLEERDLTSVRDLHESLRTFLRDYPNYPERVELDYMLQWAKGMLVRYELYVARYYLGRGEFDAAAARTEYALSNFQETGLEPEALVLLAEIHLKRGDEERARRALHAVLNLYSESPFTVPARRFLARLGEPVAQKRMGADASEPSE
jgi:outer membrane protein assembly factor BamD